MNNFSNLNNKKLAFANNFIMSEQTGGVTIGINKNSIDP